MPNNSYFAQRLTGCEKFQRTLLKLDFYKQEFHWILPDNNDMYRSLVGSTMSILTQLIILTFAVYKLAEMSDNAEYQVLTSRKDYFYELTDDVNYEDANFVIAAAVTDYDGNQKDITDPSIGEIKFYKKRWGGALRGGFFELPQTTCDPSSFNHDGNNAESIFFETDEPYLLDGRTYTPKMKCLSNHDDYLTYGNFDSSQGHNLVVVFERCTAEKSKIPCKSDEEFKQWAFYKYIALFTNQKEFISHKFGSESVKAKSFIKWFPLNSELRSDFVMQIYRNEIEMHDSILGLGASTMVVEKGYEIEQMPTREMIYTEPFQNAITFEVSRQQRHYKRSVYTILDLLAQIGGLVGVMGIAGATCVQLFQYRGAYQFLMRDLFLD